MESKEIRLVNLRTLIKESRSASALAGACGTSSAYISQILSKKTKGNIGNGLARRLELATNKPRGWLDQLHETNYTDVTLSVVPIPIIQPEKMLSAECPKNYIQHTLQNHAAENGRSKHEGLFGIEVVGDAMSSITHISTSICHGDLAVIDENKNPAYGDILLFEKEKTIKVRQLIQDGNEKVLKPFNPQYPVIPFSANIKVLGVMVELRRKIKINTVG
jgi:SOS-response transcriptional repressor LexA